MENEASGAPGTAATSPDVELEDGVVHAGVATRDITPADPITMSGYAARTGLSTGVHDPLTVRALVVGRAALVTVDVVGLHERFCERVRIAASPWVDDVLVHATHTHSGPGSIPGRLGGVVDSAWLEGVEDACVSAIRSASLEREEVRITAGYGEDPGVARNRRRPDGPVDPSLPVAGFERADGTPLALLVSYACHPVVLNAENHLLSADYPGVVRARMERNTGATVLFATSCAGDLNTGHTLDGTFGPDRSMPRTFEQCDIVGRRVADAALRGRRRPGRGTTDFLSSTVRLSVDPTPRAALDDHSAVWAERAMNGRPADRPLYEIWTRWADNAGTCTEDSWTARVSVVRWGPAVIVGLPGEPFCAAGQEVRERVAASTGAPVVFVLGYSDGCPGYLPTAHEYSLGGYEVAEAHRYYGMPGAFSQGSVERLVDEVVELAHRLPPHPQG